MSPNVNCYTEHELIAYLQGTLPEVKRRAVESHLADCDACTKIVKAINKHLLREFGSDSKQNVVADEVSEHGNTLTGPLDRDQASLDMLEPSQTVDHLGRLKGYDIIRVLGRGGYGMVFEALDSTLHRSVAIKVLTGDLARLTTSRRRFIREARAGAAINHPNVVTIHAVEESGDQPFIVMELIQGETLYDRIRREPKLDLLDILRISSQIAQGLAAAHAQGIIHRDVKPGNIMLVDKSPRVKIADFGLARVATENVELTSHGVAVGTPAYMSPEQVRGEEIDSRSDLFAMGCVMYAMATGHSPFHGRTALDIAMRIETFHPRRLAELSNDIPEFLGHIVARLLEKDREKRFQSAAEVADVLGRHLAILNQTPTDKFPVALRMSMFEPKATTKRSRWSLVLGAIAIIAMAAMAGGWFYFRSPESNLSQGVIAVTAAPEPVPESSSPVPAQQRQPEVSVAKTGGADFTTIGEALRNVAPGGKVTIQDDAEYAESILLTDATQFAGLRIASPQHATVRSNTIGPVVAIHSIPGLRWDGLNILAQQRQLGVDIKGECPGLEMSDVEIRRIGNLDGSEVSVAGMVLHNGAAGTTEAPLLVRDVVIRETNVGVVIGNHNELGVTPQHIVVERCTVHGLSRKTSTLLALLFNIEDVSIRHNVFSNGIRGISVVASESNISPKCDLSHNTWHELDNWFGWTGPIESPLSIQVHHNLIVDSGQIIPPAALFTAINNLPPAFTGNVAVAPSAVVGDRFKHLADVVADFPLLSRDQNHPDYLKPDFDRLEGLGFAPGSAPGRYSASGEP